MINYKKISIKLGVLLFWLAVWEILARLLNFSFIIPSASETILTFFGLFAKAIFYKSVLLSIIRILSGYILGLLLGLLLGFVTHKSTIIRHTASPIMNLLRSTPVASFIMILWFLLSDEMIPITIGMIMVMPIIWQSTVSGLESIPSDLLEVSAVYNFSKKKKLKILILPALYKYLIPSVITSSGLAWKAGIAAEIITYTSNSIGQHIKNSKDSFDGANLFAWTIAVMLLSLLIEFAIKKALRKVKKI